VRGKARQWPARPRVSPPPGPRPPAIANAKAFATSLPQDPEMTAVVKDTAREVLSTLVPSLEK